ncbi:nuclear transport factor 2 family protein [Alteromonas sp. AMM-1]|uniref:nuclear transport factor 2 family protein n=1 Tax=Alteromonas sp. AMM-1 TaxID=3394233 RepID=UPI0039A4E5B0
MMKTKRWGLLAWVVAALWTSFVHAAELEPEQAKTLVQQQIDAQLAFDADTLKRILHDSYLEVSPVGEIDTKEQVVAFYDPAKKRPGPAATLSDLNVRVYQQTAVVTGHVVFAMTMPDGKENRFTMTGSWVIAEHEGVATIVSAHYTPVRK